MKHVKSFSLYESSHSSNPDNLTQRQIDDFLFDSLEGVSQWSLNKSTGMIDIQGHLNVSDSMEKYKITRMPVQLGVVTGRCVGNFSKLQDMRGLPQEVRGNFSITHCNIRSLKGAPEKVGGDFIVTGNGLISLKGMSQEIRGNVDVSYNSFSSLEGCTRYINGNFICTGNPLISLEGAPLEIKGLFNCGKISRADKRSLIIPWNLAGWFKGSKEYPELFTPNFMLKRIADEKEIPQEALDYIIQSHDNMNYVRKNLPKLWTKVQAFIGSNDAAETSADLGELGF
jgi:hypothetical protein